MTAEIGTGLSNAAAGSAVAIVAATAAAAAVGRPSAPLVKVCGLTRPQDVVLAVELGAWAVGFVLALSPRRVTQETAAALAAEARRAAEGLPHRDPVLTVGVFLAEDADVIAGAVQSAGLDAVQLHAPQSGARAVRAALAARGRQALVIQAVAVPAAGVAAADLSAAVSIAADGADLLLFDTKVDGRAGGTGTVFPWELAREAAAGLPFLVAGGLGPANVAQAWAAARPAGLDVSSGVESSPGIKDAALLRALFGAAGRLGSEGGRAAPPVS